MRKLHATSLFVTFVLAAVASIGACGGDDATPNAADPDSGGDEVSSGGLPDVGADSRGSVTDAPSDAP